MFLLNNLFKKLFLEGTSIFIPLSVNLSSVSFIGGCGGGGGKYAIVFILIIQNHSSDTNAQHNHHIQSHYRIQSH